MTTKPKYKQARVTIDKVACKALFETFKDHKSHVGEEVRLFDTCTVYSQLHLFVLVTELLLKVVKRMLTLRTSMILEASGLSMKPLSVSALT